MDLTPHAVDEDPHQTLRGLLAANRSWARGRSDPLPLSSCAHNPTVAVAVVCSDLGLAPETLFGLSSGQLLVAQVPGPFVDDSVVETVRFGLQVFGLRLVLVLTHEGCRVLRGDGMLPTTATERLACQTLQRAERRHAHPARACAHDQAARLHCRGALPSGTVVVPAVLWESGLVETLLG